MNHSYVVQILVPTQTGKGEPVSTEWFDNFLQELTDRFGGATSFVRAPGQGLWRSDGTTERDTIAVLESDGREARPQNLPPPPAATTGAPSKS